MSFFGRKSDPPPSPPTVPAAAAPLPPSGPSLGVRMATIELEAMTNLFNKLSETCFDKCITKFNTAELQIGELSCEDRCAIKYMEAQTVVGEIFKKQNQQQQQQLLQQNQQL